MEENLKQLLVKDLCARLPYGVKGLVTFNGNIFSTQPQVEDRTIDGKLYDRFAEFQESWYDNVIIKPYLFPLSSMTEEQKEEYNSYFASVPYYGDNIHIHYYSVESLIEFYNKYHLDWRGLIPMGLAEDATDKNIY